MDRNEALSELAAACGAIAFSLVPDPAALLCFSIAKEQCRQAGMSDQEIEAFVADCRDAAREAIQKTFPHETVER